MKAKIILGLLVVGLMANGSSCLNDPIIVPLNAPLQHCETTNPGGTWGVVNGEAGFVDDAGTYRPVVMFSGTGKDFVQRRSLLKDQAPLITPVQNNLTLLEGIIEQFVQDPENTVVRVYSRGTVSPPVSGQEICVEILVQVDGKVSTD
ncbi:MAG: hypothetical protein H6Q29_179 [Bacteroidetes bacterium]|nr:hypothetical protein [Bacteroidota bacterium]